MIIKRINQHPELIPVLATWFHHEWGGFSPYHSIENEMSRLQRHAASDRVPFTLIAFKNESPVASVSVITHDESPFPWLTNVFVSAGFRRCGVGTFIVNNAIEEVKKLGFQKLLLVTIEKAGFFKKLDWEVVDSSHYGQTVTIMEKRLHTPMINCQKHVKHSDLMPARIDFFSTAETFQS
ncbi:MAG: GNAT family N-acetyltransferase [bacterium]